MAEPIIVLFEVENPGFPRNILLDGVPIFIGEGGGVAVVYYAVATTRLLLCACC